MPKHHAELLRHDVILDRGRRLLRDGAAQVDRSAQLRTSDRRRNLADPDQMRTAGDLQ